MRGKPLRLGVGILAISVTTLIGVLTANAHSANVFPISNHETYLSESDIPESVNERMEHPDVIYTEDGMYEKTSQSLENLNSNEVVYDSAKTTAETKFIIEYDATYIKVKENN